MPAFAADTAGGREAVIQDALRQASATVEQDLQRLTANEERANALGELAMLYHAQDRLDEAIACYRQALREHAEHRWHYLLAVALTDRGQLDLAIAEYQRAIASAESPLARYRLGRALLVSGDHVRAKQQLLRAQTALPNSAAVLAALGDAAMAARDWPRAKEHLERAAGMAPEAGRIAYRLAMTYRQLGDSEKAAHWLARRNAVAPAVEDPLLLQVAAQSLSAKFFLEAGNQAWARGEQDAALAAYRHATALEPDNVDAALALAHALSASDENQAARAEVHRALAIDPASARGWYLLAHLLRNGEHDKALAAVQRSLELADDRAARTLLAAMWMRARRFAAAGDEYQMLASRYPEAAYYRYWLGMARLADGHCQKARLALADAVRLQGNWGQAHIARARADALCGDAEAKRHARQRALELLKTRDDADTRLTLALAELAASNSEAARELAEAHRGHGDAKLLLDALATDVLPASPFASGSDWWLPPELR